MADLDAVKNNWSVILKNIPSDLSVLLSHAEPGEFDSGRLTLCFDNDIHKQLCQSNGKVGKIENALTECFGTKIKVNFIIDSSNAVKPVAKKGQNEIVADPAVQMLIKELGGRIAGIEED